MFWYWIWKLFGEASKKEWTQKILKMTNHFFDVAFGSTVLIVPIVYSIIFPLMDHISNFHKNWMNIFQNSLLVFSGIVKDAQQYIKVKSEDFAEAYLIIISLFFPDCMVSWMGWSETFFNKIGSHLIYM